MTDEQILDEMIQALNHSKISINDPDCLIEQKARITLLKICNLVKEREISEKPLDTNFSFVYSRIIQGKYMARMN